MQYETELFEPIALYFSKQEYRIKGEVKNCDVIAYKNENIIAIELKLHLNLEVIIQAVERQKVCDIVYIAVPMLKKAEISSRHEKILGLLKRLEIGLLYVKENYEVIEKLKPIKFDRSRSRQKNLKNSQSLLNEIVNRKSSNNIGGSSKAEIMTAYREKAIEVAKLLEKHVLLKPSHLIAMGMDKKIYYILRNNYYEWFVKDKNGFYKLSEKGYDYLNTLKAPSIIYD